MTQPLVQPLAPGHISGQRIKTDIIIALMVIIRLIQIIHIILIISIISQVRVDLGIPDHVRKEKRATIAATIDGLGDKFKPELRAAWLAYIRETYPDGPVEIDEYVPDAIGLYAR